MNKYICIHCHFYQPPRENPWLEGIEYQESAYPYHDWNERISDECYRANGNSRILDGEGWVTALSNNYAKISFNFGPTLLSWLEEKEPETYRNILEGDKESLSHFQGHGSAIAQAYNHMILPLANRRDKETQIKWGIRDFEHRFNRLPESLWLPETAVDTESLDILSDYGLKYVILAPRQADCARHLGDDQWQDVSGEKVNPRQAYQINLPSGRTIAAFFYDGPISKAIAFEGLLQSGDTLTNRLREGFLNSDPTPQLMHIATDGETYGHHHHHGDMALAYALYTLDKQEDIQLVNYGRFLELHPPTMEARIHENSSWSCAHGVERWKSDCSCNSGGKPGWHQRWREPFRNALDWARDSCEKRYEEVMVPLCRDPWQIRNHYIDIILNRSKDNLGKFAQDNVTGPHTQENLNRIFKLLEMQRHLLLMYTSCAWFFDEISGIETVQNLKYALRALELAEEILELPLREEFSNRLQAAESNLPELSNGRNILEQYAQPAIVDFNKVIAHFALSSVFKNYGVSTHIYCYSLQIQDFQKLDLGKSRLTYGKVEITSGITLESSRYVFSSLYMGDHHIISGISNSLDDSAYKRLIKQLNKNFYSADLTKIIRQLDKAFKSSLYSIKDLFKDEQNEILSMILRENLSAVEDKLIDLHTQNFPTLRYISEAGITVPKVYLHIADFVQNRLILNKLDSQNGNFDLEEIQNGFDQAKRWNLNLNLPGISKKLQGVLMDRLNTALEQPLEIENHLTVLSKLLQLAKSSPLNVELGPIQNRFFAQFIANKDLNPVPSKMNSFLRDIAEQLQLRWPTVS